MNTNTQIDADVVVVGGGPAGIAAATRAAESGRTVVLLDESPEPGGQIWRHRAGRVPRGVATRWIARLTHSGATMLRGTSVVDAVPNGPGLGFTVSAEQSRRPRVVRAQTLVLATGARERFIPFQGWTLPGVIGIGAAQAMHKTGVSFAGKRVVIAGSGPLILPVAAALSADGARVLLAAEQAPRSAVARFTLGMWRTPLRLFEAARYRAAFASTPYQLGTWITAARGDTRLREVDVTDGRAVRTMACDVLCAAFGLVPNTELPRLVGCAVAGGAVMVNAQQETTVPGAYCAGEPTGIGGMELSIVEGQIAGLCSAGRQSEAELLYGQRARLRASAAALDRAFALRAELRAVATPDTIVCRCEDVPLGAIDPGWTMRKAKLYTRVGMGPCQGRVCGAALEYLYGWPADTTRVPCEPALYSTLAAGMACEDPLLPIRPRTGA
ncbi:MAG: FAD/NAD(P)-binding oxidoreductase [bacterium]